MDFASLSSHYGVHGPVAAATEFFDSLVNADFKRCWKMWTPELRRNAAEVWVDANLDELLQTQPRQRGELILAIANTTEPEYLVDPDRSLWESFEYTQVLGARTSWATFIELYETGRLGAASHPRLLAPDRERVILTETDPSDPFVFTAPTDVLSIRIDLLWTGDKWMIADVP